MSYYQQIGEIYEYISTNYPAVMPPIIVGLVFIAAITIAVFVIKHPKEIKNVFCFLLRLKIPKDDTDTNMDTNITEEKLPAEVEIPRRRATDCPIKNCSNITELYSKLDKINLAIEKLDKRLCIMDKDNLKNMLFNDSDKDIFKRLVAFYRLTCMNENHRVKEKGLALILDNKDVWLNVLSIKLEEEIVNQKYFDDVMQEARHYYK